MSVLQAALCAGLLTAAAGTVQAQTLSADDGGGASPSAGGVNPMPEQDFAYDPTTRFSFSAGASSWTGDFGGASDTDISAALFTVRRRVGGLRIAASLPWMRIESRGLAFTGVDGAPVIVARDVSPVSRVRDGLGDLTLAASYLLPADESRLVDVDLTAKVKLPTSSVDEGVSSGETDYVVGAEVSRSVGSFVPALSVRYRSFGDPDGFDLKDGFAVSASSAYLFADRVAAVLSYDYAEAASRTIKDSHELSAGVSAPLMNTDLRVTAYASTGLSEGAADLSGGVALSLAF